MKHLPVTIHLGLPKTATTCFQTNLFATHSQIHYFGKFKGGRILAPVRPALIAKFCRIQPVEPGDIRAANLAMQLDYAAEKQLCPVLSREGLAGGSRARKYLQARLLKKHFGPCKIILFTREPISFITSYYAEMLKAFQFKTRKQLNGWMKRLPAAPCYFDINEWMDVSWAAWRSPRQYISYADTAQIYAHVFGKENIKLFIFEEFVKHPERVTEELCNYLEINPEEGIRLITQKRANDRITMGYIHQLQEIEQSPEQAQQFKKSPPRIRRQILDPKIQSGDKFMPELSGKWIAKINAVSEKQNQRLINDWNLPLPDYGYQS